MNSFSPVSLEFPKIYGYEDLNDLGCSLGASGTLAMNQKAKSFGSSVISFSLGEPDLPPPPEAFQSVQKALEHQEYRYTPTSGLLDLRKAILNNFYDSCGKKPLSRCPQDLYTPTNILVSTGAKQSLFNTLAVTLQKDKKVLLASPYWVSYGPMAHMAGGGALVLKTDHHHKLCPKALDEALKERQDIQWIVFSSPGNPSGSVYSYEELQAILLVLKKYPHVFILWDAIYQELYFDKEQVYHPLDVDPSFHERFVFIDGPSKSFSMTGWRIGWAIGPQHIIEAMERYQSHSTSNASSLSQYGCLGALTWEGRHDFLHQRRELFQHRRNCLMKVLLDVFGSKISFSLPQGAFYIFADVSGIMKHKGHQTSMDLAMDWLENLHISSVPGLEFGKESFIRFSFSLGEEKIKEAGKRWATWMSL